MLIILRKGDSEGGYRGSLLCIPVCQWWCSMDGDAPKLRFFALVPRYGKDLPYCEVDCCVEEIDSWQIIGGDKEFNTNPFYESDLLISSMNADPLDETKEQINDDLYFVWDDGASYHMERAQRLYETYKDIIKKHEKDAVRLWEEEASRVYAADLKIAKERHLDTKLLKKARSKHGGYGWFPQATIEPI